MSSEIIFRDGEFAYRYERDFIKWPRHMENPSVAGIEIKDGKIYLATRSIYPVSGFTLDGDFLFGFGDELNFTRIHGLGLTKDNCLWVCDDGRHVCYKLDMEGNLLKSMGTLDKPSKNGYDPTVTWPFDIYTTTRAGEPFNRPTRMIEAPNGDLYCCDGYGNVAIHRFDAQGNLIRTWGGPGNEGQLMRLPHSLCLDAQGRVWVCDRENDRIVVFTAEGEFIRSFERLYKPSEAACDGKYVYVVESGRGILIYNMDLEQVAQLGMSGGDSLLRGHSLAVAENGDLYIGQIGGLHALVRLVRI